jgi:uroporphyrinogen-III synthase
VTIPKRFRALVTRPREDAENLAAALETRGVAALIEPLIEIRYLPAEGLDLNGVQAILCTSANGVRALARASDQRGLPLLAVGNATAACARAEGFEAVESAAGDAADLGRLAAARLHPDNGRLLHAAGAVAAGDLLGSLQAQGFIIERRVLYEAFAAAALSQAAVDSLRRGWITFALFFSPRTAATFVRLARDAGVAECCVRITALSLSKAVDDALGVTRWENRWMAERPSQQALLTALDHIIDSRREIGQE